MNEVPSPAARRHPVMRYLARFDDGEVIRWAFRGLLAGAIIVLGLDVKALYDRQPASGAPETVFAEPMLPPVAMPGQPGADPRPHVTLDDDALRGPLRFELKADGVMSAQGSIDIGAAARLAAELETRGEYVKVVSLNSPGGSLDDAMAMARLLRERGIGTEVADGALCASSCPLVMAGGAERRAGEKAAVGLHQFYAVAGEAPSEPAQAMSDAQATAARIARYLAEMDIDPALWLHALDTPPQTLYYLSPEELVKYRLVTEGS